MQRYFIALYLFSVSFVIGCHSNNPPKPDIPSNDNMLVITSWVGCATFILRSFTKEDVAHAEFRL